MDICEAFEACATDDDRAHRLLIPCFDEFYGAILRALPFAPEDEFNVLNLGAGSGLLAALLLRQFPGARLTLVDVVADKLDQARDRLAAQTERLTLVEADFARTDPPGEFDVVISALTLHHISDLDKRTLYRSIYYALNRLGTLITADRLHGPTAPTFEHYEEIWAREVRALGASEAEIERTISSRAEDHHSTLNEHLEWLRNSGFLDVDVHYKNGMFAVLGGHRPDI